MSVATEKITEIQDQVRDLVARIQEPVVHGFQAVATKVEDRLPELHIPDLGEKLPTAEQLTDARDKVAEKLADLREQLTEAVATATEPVRRQFVTEPAAKTTTKATTKPAAKASTKTAAKATKVKATKVKAA
ncbi:MAG TPA: hypothetical protein VIT01_17145 [Acidimicrobiales bacterium]